jgi:hypothetical protein
LKDVCKYLLLRITRKNEIKLLKNKRCNHLSSYVVDSRGTSVLVALRQEIVEGGRARKELGKRT